MSGRVKLLGAPNKKGKQDLLSKWTLAGSPVHDADGDLALGGADDHSSGGELVIPGESIALDRDGTDGSDGLTVIRLFGNGSWTKNPTNEASAGPQLL